MPVENQPATPAAPTVDVKAIATAAAQELLSQRDNQLAVAAKIEGLLSDKNTAEARASKAEGELKTANGTIADLTSKLELAEAAKKKAEDDKKKSDEEKDDFASKFKKAKASLDAINIEKTIASRTAALETAGLKTDIRVAKATAHNKDTGEFTLSDEAFTAYVAELSEAFTAGKASVPAPTTPATPAAASTENKPAEGTPAPAAATPAATPAAPATPAAEGTTQATASAVPAAPDLSVADIQAQAVAAVLSGQANAPTAGGVSQMAAAFGGI